MQYLVCSVNQNFILQLEFNQIISFILDNFLQVIHKYFLTFKKYKQWLKYIEVKWKDLPFQLLHFF